MPATNPSREDFAALLEESFLTTELYEGAVVKGTVKNITSYGVFVDLGGVDGLIQGSPKGLH